MGPGNPKPQQIVETVTIAWGNGDSDEKVVEHLMAMGLPHESATDAIDLVRSGITRGALISAGLPANQITSDCDDDPVYQAAIKAGRVRMAQTKREPPPALMALLAQMDSDDVEVRRRAAYELGQHRTAEASQTLVQALQDPDLYVRIYSIQSLGRLKAKEAVAPCAALLSTDVPRTILVNVIKALVEIKDHAAVPALIAATTHSDDFVRHDAAWALGELPDASSIPALQLLLKDKTIPVEKDEDGLTRNSSIYSVADQAQRSLQKIGRGSRPIRSAASEFALSLGWTVAGLLMLGVTLYAHFQHDYFSRLGLSVG